MTTPQEVHEIRDRHWREGPPIPEHHREHPCDACRLLLVIDAQTRLLAKALAPTLEHGVGQPGGWPAPAFATGRTVMILIRYFPEHPEHWLTTKAGISDSPRRGMTDEEEEMALTHELRMGLRAMRHRAKAEGLQWHTAKEND